MLYEFIRLFKRDGSLTDLSIDNQDEGIDIPFDLAMGEYFYMAEYFPFNNFYIKLPEVNATPAKINIEYWNGTEWIQAVDVLDGTSLSGASLARSGTIQWSPDIDDGWQKISNTSDNNAPSELQTKNIYDMYWIRFSFDANLDGITQANRIAYSFTTSQQIKNLDVEINDFLNAFEVGKTDWESEILTSSKLLIMDLRRMGLVLGRGQILRFDDVSLACDYRTLFLIYSNLGKGYIQKKTDAWNSYQELLTIKRFKIDQNKDGRVDEKEIIGAPGMLVR